MAEYIEREALLAELRKGTIVFDDLYGMGIMSGVDFALKKICDTPAADVKPVIRSEWEITDVDHAYGHKCYHCPECGEDEWRYDEPNFCPNCGADMRPEGGADHGTARA